MGCSCGGQAGAAVHAQAQHTAQGRSTGTCGCSSGGDAPQKPPQRSGTSQAYREYVCDLLCCVGALSCWCMGRWRQIAPLRSGTSLTLVMARGVGACTPVEWLLCRAVMPALEDPGAVWGSSGDGSQMVPAGCCSGITARASTPWCCKYGCALAWHTAHQAVPGSQEGFCSNSRRGPTL